MSTILRPIQLLEINVISAQDLARVSRNMRTYAIAWVNRKRKLSTRVDVHGGENPTWNDKFVFRVDEGFLRGDTSAVMIEIYAQHWFRDILVGTVRVIVGNLIPPQNTLNHNNHQVQLGMRFVALQVRRPSGRPQGILNIGAALLDSSKRSMPLYNQFPSSAVGYKQLMGEDEKSNSNNHIQHANKKSDDKTSENNINQVLVPWMPKPELRRTKSESSSMIKSSIVVLERGKKTKGKSSSIINGSEVERKKFNNKTKSKASSTISISPGSSDLGGLAKAKYRSTEEKINLVAGRKVVNYPTMPMPIDFDPGPSASEVAAAMFYKSRQNRMIEDTESEIIGKWDIETDKEGLQSKLARWRAEVPPLYDRRHCPDYSSSITSSEFNTSGKPVYTPRKRNKINNNRKYRHSDGDIDYEDDDDEDDDNGRGFSCFSNICGLECSISCGGGGGGSSVRRSSEGGQRMRRSPSLDSLSYV